MKPMRVGEVAAFCCESCKAVFNLTVTELPDVRVPQCPYACPFCKAETLVREKECVRMSRVQAAARKGFDTIHGYDDETP